MARARSIRSGLTTKVVAPLLGLLAIGIWISFNGAWQQAQLVTDRLLAASARVIAEDLYFADGRITAEIPPAALEMFASESRDRVVYRIIGPDNQLVAGYTDLPTLDARAIDVDPIAYDLTFRTEPMRGVAFPQQVATPKGIARVTVIVAETVKARSQLFASLLYGQVLQQLLLVLLAAAFIWIGIGLELRPLLALAKDVGLRRPSDFSPISGAGIQTEVQPLVKALNSFMSRLGRTVARQRDFLEMAAHQLRTPLAVLKTQTGFALRTPDLAEKNGALRSMDEDLTAMTRLANQLLLLGRAEHDPHSFPLERIDLTVIARQLVGEMAPVALDAGVELALDAAEHAVILGDGTLARELLANLIDNAALYAGSGSLATVFVRQVGDTVELEVIDNGTGVVAEERKQLGTRFHRGRAVDARGSGLGLSIVADLAQMFGGRLLLSEPQGGGFAVKLVFPGVT